MIKKKNVYDKNIGIILPTHKSRAGNRLKFLIQEFIKYNLYNNTSFLRNNSISSSINKKMNQNDSDLISFDFKYNPNKKIIFQKPQLPIIYSNSTSSYKDSTIKGKPSSSNQLNNLNRGNLIFKHLNNISYHNKQRSKFLDNSSYISNKILSNINNNILSYKESKQDILDCKYNNNDIYLLKKIKPSRKNKSNYYTNA